MGAVALMGLAVAPSLAEDTGLRVAYVTPAELTPQLAASRLAPPPIALRPSFSAEQPALTNDLLAAYVARQQKLENFNGFDVVPARLTEDVLLSYVDRTYGTNLALNAIADLDRPALDSELLESYASKRFVPTVKKLKLSEEEKLCLTQAIYHEARGESEAGQKAVANVIINRALSKKFPSTICGVVFQNADKGRYRCQFTFACDGRSDMGTERAAWNRAMKLAEAAYSEFQDGERPGVVPNSTLYYHTTAVSPSWSRKFQRVASIGSHLFYAVN